MSQKKASFLDSPVSVVEVKMTLVWLLVDFVTTVVVKLMTIGVWNFFLPNRLFYHLKRTLCIQIVKLLDIALSTMLQLLSTQRVSDH